MTSVLSHRPPPRSPVRRTQPALQGRVLLPMAHREINRSYGLRRGRDGWAVDGASSRLESAEFLALDSPFAKLR